MGFDDACHVFHAAVVYFDVVFVEDFVEFCVFGEVLAD